MNLSIIVGNTDYALMLRDYMFIDGISTTAFTVDREYIIDTTIKGIPVIAIEDLTYRYSPETTTLFLGIGYSKRGQIRRNIFERLKHEGYSFANYIHRSVSIFNECNIGEGNVFFENVVVQRNTSIGNGNLFWPNVTICHDNKIGNYNTFGAGSVTNGHVNIGECNFIGANSTVKNNISIEDYNIIGAHSYVNKNTSSENSVISLRSNTIQNGAKKIEELL